MGANSFERRLFLFLFFHSELGFGVCTGSCMGSNFKCRGGPGVWGEDGDYGAGGVRISDSIWTWESKFEEDS